MTTSLAGRAGVVTGGGSGIGRATALELAAAGAALVLGDRDGAAADAVAAEITAAGGRASALATDVTDADACLALVRACVDVHGRLDLAVNSAGTTGTPGSVVGNSDQQTVEKLTRPYWYTSQFQQLQDGNAVLVLDPLIAAS